MNSIKTKTKNDTTKLNFYIFLVLAVFIVPNLLFAQFTQLGLKLIGTGNSGNCEQGHAIAISADGNTAVVGAPSDNGVIGAAWIYTRSGGVWTQQGPKLVGTGYVGSSSQGWSVSISANGNTVAVGGYGDNGTVGAAWIFTRSGGVWAQQGPKLVGTGYNGSPRQGSSVSLSGDGNTLIVGGPQDSLIGAAWVFTRSAGIWTQQGQRFHGNDGFGNPGFGNSVSLSGDGNTLIVGGPGDITGTFLVGASWIFIRSGNNFVQQGPKLKGSGYYNNAYQGFSVSISSDGNTAIIGGYYDNILTGAAWIFTRNNGAWTQQGGKLYGYDL